MRYIDIKKLEVGKMYWFIIEEDKSFYPICAIVEKDPEDYTKRILVNAKDPFNVYSLLNFVKETTKLLVFDKFTEATWWTRNQNIICKFVK